MRSKLIPFETVVNHHNSIAYQLKKAIVRKQEELQHYYRIGSSIYCELDDSDPVKIVTNYWDVVKKIQKEFTVKVYGIIISNTNNIHLMAIDGNWWELKQSNKDYSAIIAALQQRFITPVNTLSFTQNKAA